MKIKYDPVIETVEFETLPIGTVFVLPDLRNPLMRVSETDHVNYVNLISGGLGYLLSDTRVIPKLEAFLTL